VSSRQNVGHLSHTNNARSDSLARKPFFEVPNQRERNFVGRSTTLLEIETALHRDVGHTPRIVMLHGTEGRGKTQIALTYCERQRSKVGTSAMDVFWVDATTRATRLKGLSLLYYRIGLPQHQMNDEDRAHSVIRHLDTSDLNWLLVYDGFGDGRSSVSPASIRECIPNSSGPGGTIIITTRSESCKELFREFVDADFRIGGLDPVDGATLLLKQSGIEETPESIVDAGKIVMLLWGKPLEIIRVAKELATVITILGKSYMELLQHSASFKHQIAAIPGMGSIPEDASQSVRRRPSTAVSLKDVKPEGQPNTLDVNVPSESSASEVAQHDRHFEESMASSEDAESTNPKSRFAMSISRVSGQRIVEKHQYVVNTKPENPSDVTREAILEGFRRIVARHVDVALPALTGGGILESVIAASNTDKAQLSRELQSLQDLVMSSIDQISELPSAENQANSDIVELCLQFEQTEAALDQAKLDIQDWSTKYTLLQSSLHEANASIDGLQSRLNDNLTREQGLSDFLHAAIAETKRLARLLNEHGIENKI